MFGLVLSSFLLVLVRLCGGFILERSRHATDCGMTQALAGTHRGLAGTRVRHDAIVACIPSPPVSSPLTQADDCPAA